MIFFIIIWYIIIALIPGFFWLWFYSRKDKNPEPRKLIIKVFLWGMAITIPAIAFEFAAEFFIPFTQSSNFIIIIVSSLFIVAPIEEYLKYYVIKKVAYNSPAFDEPIDGIIYGVVAGLGFATLENILVIMAEGQNAIILRFATATLMHAITAGLIGYYLSLIKFTKRTKKEKRNLIIQGLLIAILIHGLYNIIVSLQTVIALATLVVFLIVIFLMLSSKIKELKKIS